MIIDQTGRLIIRRFEKTDANFILTLLNEPSYHANIGDRGIRTLSEAEDYFDHVLDQFYQKNGFGLYVLALKAQSEELIGMCGLVNREGLDGIDLGYALLPAYWNQGFAKEACLAVMNHAKADFGLDMLLAIVAKQNEASIGLLRRLGFIHAGDFEHVDSGECLDLYRCNLSQTDE